MSESLSLFALRQAVISPVLDILIYYGNLALSLFMTEVVCDVRTHSGTVFRANAI